VCDVPDADPLEAYERLLLDVMRGDRTLFISSEEVDRLWEIFQPVLDRRPPTQRYEQGSWGPAAALDLPIGGWRLGNHAPDRELIR
jgi:glucose-6-phosphate 1-dehydrogenase